MIKKIITIFTSVMLCLMALTACSGDNYGKLDIEGVQDTSFAVTSNGGNAVEYGNYVYFINGTSGYDDTDATNNVFGKVIKGGLYRAQLTGDKNADGGFDIKVNNDSINKIKFVSTKGTNYLQEDIDVVNVECIVPKRIGTSGYAGGGIFIYDDYIYYASPNNQKNKTGVVQTTKTDFFRTKIDGSKTQLLYTSDKDTTSSPYMFYNVGDNVFVVLKDGSDIISVKLNKKSGKVEDTLNIATDVIDVVLPSKSTYSKDTTNNGVEDFIYFTRQEDSGMVAEFMRPDGSERTVWLTKASSLKLEGVRDGLLYYRTKNSMDNTVIIATNLHSAFLAEHEEDGKMVINSPSYKAYQDSLEIKTSDFNKTVLQSSNLDSMTSLYMFRPNGTKDSDLVYAIGCDETNAYLFTAKDTFKVIYEGKATVENVDIQSGKAYLLSETKLVMVSLYDDSEPVELTANYTTSGLKTDIVAGHAIFMAKADDFADGYTFFYDQNGLEGNDDPFFVGKKLDKDITPLTKSIEIKSEPTKKEYVKGDKLDLSGLEVKVVMADGTEKVITGEDFAKEDITGFDSKVVGEQTITLTYDSRTTTFKVNVKAGSGCGSVAFASTGIVALLVIGVALCLVLRKKATK